MYVPELSAYAEDADFVMHTFSFISFSTIASHFSCDSFACLMRIATSSVAYLSWYFFCSGGNGATQTHGEDVDRQQHAGERSAAADNNGR